MKTLSFTICLLLAASVSFAQMPMEKPMSVTAKIHLSQQIPVKKTNPLHYRAERMTAHLIDRSGNETRNAGIASANVAIQEVKAFPNPFNTQVDVFITDGHMDKSTYRADVMDVEGRKVHSEALFLNQSSLQLSHLSKGVYILYIEKNGKVIKQEKLVKE